MPYEPLDKTQKVIRLLRLGPASSHDEPIKCQFRVASLDDSPHYEAISYVWGDAISEQTVEVDGMTFTVTANLDSLLRHMRFVEEERLLWVDALCIEQSNLEEKNNQVSRMRHIYGNASQVIVWLGEGWPGSEMAMEFLRRLGNDAALHLDPMLEPCINVNGLDLDSQELCGHIVRLFSLPWWNRTWTVQEFVLAKRLIFQCSRTFVTQREMYMARENFWNHNDQCCQRDELSRPHPEFGQSITQSFEVPARLDFVTKSRGNAYSVLTAIAAFSGREVTDSRDRVYGMLGLGTGPYVDLVEPDYSLTPEQVSQAVLVKSIERTGTLECFSHLFEHENSKLPSFVPNWSGGFDYNGIQGLWLGYLRFFSASLNFAAQAQLIDNDKLVIGGSFVDTVKSVSESALERKFIWNGAWTELHELAGIGAQSETLYRATGESRLLALWQTLNVGMEMWFKDNNRFSRRLKGSTDLSKYWKCKDLCDAAPARKAQLWFNDMSHIFLDIEAGCYGRRFAVTEKGYFAMTQQRCQPGDSIAVLLGGSVPYVTRPKELPDSSRKYYRILGDAYVHEIMYGEALQPLDTIEQVLEEIILI